MIVSRAALLALALPACAPTLSTEPHPLVGQALSPRSEPTLDGALVSIPVRGKVTLVDVWQTSCAPCLAEMPRLDALARAHAGALVVVGVAEDDNPGLVLGHVKKLGVRYPNVVDADGNVRGALRVGAELPTTLVFDKKGTLRVARVGGAPDDVAAIEAAVKALVAEP